MFQNTMDSNPEIVKAGFLTKSPPGAAPPMSQWRRRWFVLCDSLRSYPLAERHLRLEYYQNEGDVRKMDPKGVIDLRNCSRVSSAARIKGHNYVFDICMKERTYHLAAETPTEKYEWMKTLNELLFTPPAAMDGVKEVQDLENAEIIRKKSISKASAERQSSLGELVETERQRPISCFVRPDMKPIEEFKPKGTGQTSRQHEYRQRPLPPTPDAQNASLTLQPSSSRQPSSHQHIPLQSSPSVPSHSPSPPVPKPRSRNSCENNKPTSNNSTSAPSITSSLSHPFPVADIIHQTPSSSGYENVSKPILHPDYEDIEQQPPQPPVPKPRGRTSLEDNPLNSLSNQRNHYENVSSAVSRPDYEDIDYAQSSFETQFIGGSDRNCADRIQFLNSEDYADPNIDNDERDDQLEPSMYEVPVNQMDPSTYEVPVNQMEASTYEVPVSLTSPPIPTLQRLTSNHETKPSVYGLEEDLPPVPPPRMSRVQRDSSIHSSLIDLADDGIYSELQNERTGQDSDDNEEHYGRLVRFVGASRERRFSNPEIIPISPRSHSNSPLFFSSTRSPPPPIPPPYSQPRKHYYENAGFFSTDRSNSNSITSNH